MNNSHQRHDIVASDYFDTASDALIHSANIARNKFSSGAQAVHIIFVNLILNGKKWQAISSVTTIDDIDGDGKPAIIFGHLPEKYEEFYDDLLPHVDHLNVIHNQSIWRDIKKHLLDLHFYQAVHIGEIQRIQETGGGFYRKKKDQYKSDSELEINMNSENKEYQPPLFDRETTRFQEQSDIADKEIRDEEYGVLLRNQREGRRFKNLIVK